MTTYTDVVTPPQVCSDSLPRKTKFNYGMGDFGNNIVWQMMAMFLPFFYTDVYGLNPIHAGTMYLVLRVIDAVTDPIVGMWVDRTRTKYGTCRPFILYGTIPLALSFVMLFYVPELDYTGMLIYAYVSYTLLTLAYTLVNVPFSAMAGFLTKDSDERTSLQSYRFGLGMLAGVFVAATTFNLVELLGGGDQQRGFLFTAVIFALIISACLFYCFFTVAERHPVANMVKSEKSGLAELFLDLKAAFTNNQLVILFFANILFFITLTLKGTTTIYYVVNVLDTEDKLTSFMTLGSIGAVAGAALSAWLWARFDKVKSYKALMFICAVLTAIPYWLPPSAYVTILSFGVLTTFLWMSMIPLIWSMLSDVVDYQQSRTGKNMSGLFFALFLFSLKVGLGFGTAIVLWILGSTGYDASVDVQPQEVVESINFISTLLPGLLFVGAGIIMIFYNLDSARREEIRCKLYG
ncbi:MAG: MFS transporter [Alteromonadaceae bacterium]|nr:MFS transporter [Alteromonadaceae bacterium]